MIGSIIDSIIVIPCRIGNLSPGLAQWQALRHNIILHTLKEIVVCIHWQVFIVQQSPL